MSPRLLADGTDRTVEFVQFDVPTLRGGTYTVTVTQTVNQAAPNTFPTTRRFAVAAERFTLDPSQIAAVYPPDLANGEYTGVLPHVVLSRPTLPWERASDAGDPAAPWLAVLLFDDAELPPQQHAVAADLIRAGEQITVWGSNAVGVGALPDGYVSYPDINPLDYGQRPDQECTVIDVAADVFSRVAPSAADLPYLACIRVGDTVDGEDADGASTEQALVLGNRVPLDGATAHAFLVSLENMLPYLPAPDGTPSSGLQGVTHVRLTALRAWSFTANTLGETFLGLLEDLNSPPSDRGRRISSLRLPYDGDPPTPTQVQQAMAAQAAGTQTADGARVLVDDTFAMGYVALGEHLRFAGDTVGWYRGPLAPFAVDTTVEIPISCSDAANRYDPQTGMFDVSYAAAWQLGQLLALQSGEYALALYNWRRRLLTAQVVAEEQRLIEELLGGTLPGLARRRERHLLAAGDATDPPDVVVRWLASLRLLNGVPFNYLVPDERMLPPESLRVFHLDEAWIEALLDGAFSIGRATTGEQQVDQEHAPAVFARAAAHVRTLRANPRPEGLPLREGAVGDVTGFLLRSQLVSGWARLAIVGYVDGDMEDEVPKLYTARLADDVLLCMFDGTLGALAIHEPPEQLHCGVEGEHGAFTTTLRAVTGATPGQQLRDQGTGDWATAPVPVRRDLQTLMVASAATSIETALNSRFGQQITAFTSAELALELVKGAVRVEFAPRT